MKDVAKQSVQTRAVVLSTFCAELLAAMGIGSTAELPFTCLDRCGRRATFPCCGTFADEQTSNALKSDTNKFKCAEQ